MVKNGQASKYEAFVCEGRRLLDSSAHPIDAHRDFVGWVNNVADWLATAKPNSGLSAAWSALPASTLVIGKTYDDSPLTRALFQLFVRKRLEWLGKLVQSAASGTAQDREKVSAQSPSGRIFVVHGCNDAVREKTARFLERVGLQPIILHEQPNEGRTIIEKFVEYSDVSFAVVLLTGDDKGGLKDRPSEDQELRARQNVILELGFFLGKLGRSNVCALYEESVEIPSDYKGVLFVKLDAGGAWQMSLAREMKAAKVPFDMNKVV